MKSKLHTHPLFELPSELIKSLSLIKKLDGRIADIQLSLNEKINDEYTLVTIGEVETVYSEIFTLQKEKISLASKCEKLFMDHLSNCDHDQMHFRFLSERRAHERRPKKRGKSQPSVFAKPIRLKRIPKKKGKKDKKEKKKRKKVSLKLKKKPENVTKPLVSFSSRSRRSRKKKKPVTLKVVVPPKIPNKSGKGTGKSSIFLPTHPMPNTMMEMSGVGGGKGPEIEAYCFCYRGSFGEMVQCENKNCIRKWFHFPCVGLKEIPEGAWYCKECEPDFL